MASSQALQATTATKTVAIAPTQTKAVETPVIQPQGCAIAYNYDWNAAIAIAICKAESGGRSDAYNQNSNGTDDAGIFQINSVHSALISSQDRYNDTLNANAAYRIYTERKGWDGIGWTAWSTYNNKAYLRYL